MQAVATILSSSCSMMTQLHTCQECPEAYAHTQHQHSHDEQRSSSTLIYAPGAPQQQASGAKACGTYCMQIQAACTTAAAAMVRRIAVVRC
jgi:hypothetical protein